MPLSVNSNMVSVLGWFWSIFVFFFLQVVFSCFYFSVPGNLQWEPDIRGWYLVGCWMSLSSSTDFWAFVCGTVKLRGNSLILLGLASSFVTRPPSEASSGGYWRKKVVDILPNCLWIVSVFSLSCGNGHCLWFSVSTRFCSLIFSVIFPTSGSDDVLTRMSHK